MPTPDVVRTGIESLTIDGAQYRVKGDVTYCLGTVKRETVMGLDGRHGVKITPQVAFFETSITDSKNLSLKDLFNKEEATAVVKLRNGKSLSFTRAFYAGDAQATASEGEVGVRFEALDEAEEI